MGDHKGQWRSQLSISFMSICLHKDCWTLVYLCTSTLPGNAWTADPWIPCRALNRHKVQQLRPGPLSYHFLKQLPIIIHTYAVQLEAMRACKSVSATLLAGAPAPVQKRRARGRERMLVLKALMCLLIQSQ